MKTIEVVAAIIVKDGKILATQRGYGEYKDGWEFPGGKIEPHETARQALHREIEEELLCEVEVAEEVCTSEYAYDFGTVRLTTSTRTFTSRCTAFCRASRRAKSNWSSMKP